MRTQRIHNNRQWPNPVVIKLTHVEPALVPPRVDTAAVRWDDAIGEAMCEGEILSLGDANELKAGFEYRDISGLDVMDRANVDWDVTEFQTLTAPGVFSGRLPALESGNVYEVRVVVRHPLLTLRGRDLQLSVP